MKRILKILFGSLLIAVVFNNNGLHVEAQETDLVKGHATIYCLGGTTASGSKVRQGICASSKENLGSMAVVYQRLPNGDIGDFIGYFECLDTGGTDGLKNGTTVDVWYPSSDSGKEFINKTYENGCKGNVYIQYIHNGVG